MCKTKIFSFHIKNNLEIEKSKDTIIIRTAAIKYFKKCRGLGILFSPKGIGFYVAQRNGGNTQKGSDLCLW